MKWSVMTILFGIVLVGCATTALPPVTSRDFVLEDDEKRLWLRSEEEEKVLNKSGLIYLPVALIFSKNDCHTRAKRPPDWLKLKVRVAKSTKAGGH